MQVFLDHIYRNKVLLSLVLYLSNNTRLSFFACQKDAAGAALKKAAPNLGSGHIKNRLRLHPKSGGSGSATLKGRSHTNC